MPVKEKLANAGKAIGHGAKAVGKAIVNSVKKIKEEHRKKLSTITDNIKEFYKKKYGKDSTDSKSDKRVKEIIECIKSMQDKNILQNIKTFLEVSLDWKSNKNSKIDNKVKNNKNMVESNVWKNLSTSDEVSGTILEPITKNNYTVNPVKLGGNLTETTNNISAWRLNWLKEWTPKKLETFINDFNKRCNKLYELFKGITSNEKNIEKIVKYIRKYFISKKGRLSKLTKLPSGPKGQEPEKCLTDLKRHWKQLHLLADAEVLKDNKIKDYLRGIIYQYKGFIVYAHDNPYSCKLFTNLLSNNFLGKYFKEKSKAYENEKKKGIPEKKFLDEKNEAAIKYWQTVIVPQRDIDLFEKMCKETSNSCQLQTFVQYMISSVIFVEKLELDPSRINLNSDIPEIKKACKLENFDSSILNKTLNKTINKIEDAQKGSCISRFAKWIKSKFKSKKDENKEEIKLPKKEGKLKKFFNSLLGKDKDQEEIKREILKLNEESKIFEEPMNKLSTGNLVNLSELAEINEKLSGKDADNFIESYKKVDELIDNYDTEATGNKKKMKWVESIKTTLISIRNKVSSLLTSFHQKSLEARNNFLKAFGNEEINWDECIFYNTIVDINAMVSDSDFLKSLNLGSLNIAVFLHNTHSIKIGPKQGIFDFLTKDIIKNLKSDSWLIKAGLWLIGKLGTKKTFEWGTSIASWFAPDALKDIMNWRKAGMKLDILQEVPLPILGKLDSSSQIHSHKIQDVDISITHDKFELEPAKVSFSVYLISIGTLMNSLVDSLPSNLTDFVQKDLGANLNLSSQ